MEHIRHDRFAASGGRLGLSVLDRTFFARYRRVVASNTKISDTQRLRKTHKAGKARKRALAKNGTTKSEAAMFGNVLAK
jgi:hypothetical protein